MTRIDTRFPLAGTSIDHLYPKGTATDNTVNLEFNKRLYELIPVSDVQLLDLGCSGGGLVKSVLDDGGFAVGVEGSDYSLRLGRAEWPVIPGNLFTADITKPFQLYNDDYESLKFNVVTAWEVLEHVPEIMIDRMFQNIVQHLSDDGLFICSISTMRDIMNGNDYHITVHPESWWRDTLPQLGWHVRDDLYNHFHPHWVRGPHNGMASFCLVLDRS